MDDRGPPDSSLEAVCSAISCCFISHFVDIIRKTNTVCSWQGGIRVLPISGIKAHDLHTVCHKMNYREMCHLGSLHKKMAKG